MATEFTITGVTVSGPFPETFTFAGLSAPVSGTLPTFSSAPVVFIRNSSTNRYLFVDRTSITTSDFDIDAGDVFTDDPPYTVDIGIITTDVTAAGAGVATAVSYPYYCSVQDVKDILTQLSASYDTTAEENRISRNIGHAFGRINATLAKASYQVPATNSVKQTFSSALTASENVVTLNQVEDGTKFSVGRTARIHGTTGSTYADEFAPIVAINGDVVDVLFLKNSYDADGTIEQVEYGMETLRHLNAQGAALLFLGGLTVGFETTTTPKTQEITDEFNRELKAIEDGKMRLLGLSRNTATTYVVEESSDLFNSGKPAFTDGMVF